MATLVAEIPMIIRSFQGIIVVYSSCSYMSLITPVAYYHWILHISVCPLCLLRVSSAEMYDSESITMIVTPSLLCP